MMKPFSHQAVLLQAAWNDVLSRNEIIANMIDQANVVLSFEIKNAMDHYGIDIYDYHQVRFYDWSELAYDGMFAPFDDIDTVRCAAYMDYIGEHGNADDECFLLTCYWITALSNADPIKYAPLIHKMMGIQVNGL